MCKNEYRKQAFRSSILQPNSHRRIDEVVTIALDHESFQKKLDYLLKEEDEETRTIFILRHELEMPFSEIAEILHCPEGTVMSRLFYLKKKLALALEHFKIVLEK